MIVPGGNIDAHNQAVHALKLCDMCYIKVESYKMPEHKVTYTLCTSNEIFLSLNILMELCFIILISYILQKTLCSKREVSCRYCKRQKVVTALSEHEVFCGNKTEQCNECYEWISLKDWDGHQNKAHGSCSKRFGDRSNVNSTLEIKGSLFFFYQFFIVI